MGNYDEALKTIPRRARVDLMTRAEASIREAALEVETMPADVRLTDAVVLLQAARECVADFVDGIDRRSELTRLRSALKTISEARKEEDTVVSLAAIAREALNEK